MKRNWHFVVLILLIAGGGLLLRLPRLDRRPMHGDEAVHAVKFNTLWTTGEYVYDPHEYHGPALYYATLPAMWLSGAKDFTEASETTFRIVPVVFGVGLILLLLLIMDGLGRWAALVAGVFIAVSPAMTFYSRYYIQETLLVFFTLATIAAGWRYVRTRRVGWALLTGACVGLMHASKETCLISFGCLLLALFGTLVRELCGSRAGTSVHQTAATANHARGAADFSPRGRPRGLKPTARCSAHPNSHWLLVISASILLALIVSVLLYSALFRHWSGPVDSIRAFATYFQRAGGNGLHDHPWYYYLQLLLFSKFAPGPWWSEALILVLAVLGMVAVLVRHKPSDADGTLLGFLARYALLMLVIYTAIPYKTPWCLLQFFCPLILLAGVGVVVLFRWLKTIPLRVVAGVLLSAATVHLGWQDYQTNFRFHTDYRNPYVYAHPLTDVVRLATWIDRLGQVHPDGRRMLIKVITPDPWPLPWYLRRFERVGYWESPPEDVDAPVVITTHNIQPAVMERLHHEYHNSHYGLRPDIVLVVNVEQSLWEAFVAQQDSQSSQEDEAGTNEP